MKRDQTSTSTLATLFQQAYESYGWMSCETQPGCVIQPREQEFDLPGGAWSGRECCANRTQQCRLTVCNDQIHPKEVSWETLERVHPVTHLEMLRTNHHELFDVFDLKIRGDGVFTIQAGDGDGDGAEERLVKIEGAKAPTDSEVELLLAAARRDTGGSILAAALAYVYGFMLSFCGGQHHASTVVSEGSSIFADVPLSWMILRETIQKLGLKSEPVALYIDVDVHHANGFAHCLDEIPGLKDHFFMIDLFNSEIWPWGGESVDFLSVSKPFKCNTSTRAYLKLLKEALDEADKLPRPDIVYYMANNDILEGDPLGEARIKPDGILERDRLVLTWAQQRGIPVVMISGSGYADHGCRVTRDTLSSLNHEFCLWDQEFATSVKKIKK